MLLFENKIHLRFSSRQPAVLLLHAFPLNARMWENQIELLNRHEISSLAFDYPGFGNSRPWPSTPSIDDYADAAYQMLQELDIPRVAVVGLSMGGYIALALFRKYPEIFAGLVLANTRATADTPDARQRRFDLITKLKNQNSLDELVEFHLQKFFTEQTRQSTPGLLQRAEEIMRESSLEGVIQALDAMANRPDSINLLQKIPFSTLILAGDKDTLTTVEDAERMLGQIKDSELKIIAGAAHLSNVEAEDRFNQILLDYLSRIGFVKK